MNRGPEKIGRLIGAIVVLGLFLLLSGCSTYRLSTLNNDTMYPTNFVIQVNDDVKVDTLNFRELKWKLRTDFNFRWNFAQYAMDQPLNWYWNNPRLDGIWKPFNRFDVYFNRINFWYDWAWGYNHHSWYHNYAWNWGWNTWNYHRWSNYSWYYPYYWNESYWFRDHWRMKINDYAWNNRDNSNVVRVRGPRGSRNINLDNNINIENIISRRYDNPPARPNLNDINIDNPDKRTFIGRLIENWKDNNIRIREFNNVDNLSNDQINRLNIRSNNSSQSGNNGRGVWSGQNVPPKPIRSWQSTSGQSGQIYRGSGSSGIQQSGAGSSISRSGSGGVSGRKN